MIIDLNSAQNSSVRKQYDVCICGTGPAGITVARVLAKQGKKVALFEGGDLEYSEISQSCYDGESIGVQYWDAVRTARLRFFGGTSNHWAGRCAYFDEVDFEQRHYFGLPGWPITRADVFQHFDAACSILDISKDAFQASHKSKWKGNNFRFSESTLSPPTRFGTKYYSEFKESSKIDVYINANLTNISLNDNHDAATSFEVRNYSNQKFFFQARKYVIALGSIENARLLLNCDKQVNTGIGNQNDMVGRCFMEHFNVNFGRFISDDSPIWQHGGIQLNPSEDLIRKMQIGNAVLSFDINSTPASYGRLRVLKQTIRESICKSDSLTDISRNFVDFDCPGDGIISSLIEQTPNPDSRVFLGAEKDMFGLRRVKLDWKINAADNKTIRTLGIEAAKEMARIGLSRVQLADFILDESIDIREYGLHAHQMGTTRMSEDPKYGVVDKNLRIHGFKNIFVAGSSVFPTGGGTNPTLTVVMLSERLGHHLADEH
ncbi:MAG: GMC family oxidoreductase [Gammaproteobacteria bacterium]|nr:GMC family oxidoreductase [Gammaproteobacteria bacterium]MBU1969719.1 GMC family oxidoreductase [Gammaproteobacteria bacterium]